MAVKFVDWPFAFEELQRTFNLFPIISFPTSLHNQLKPEFSTLNPHINDPSPSNLPPSNYVPTPSNITNNNTNTNQTPNIPPV